MGNCCSTEHAQKEAGSQAKTDKPVLVPAGSDKSQDIEVKILLVGSLGCGKSSLVSKYAPNSTDECSTVVRTYGSRSITVKLYEIPEPTHATSKHYTDSDAIIYLYGNDNRESFQQIEELIDATLNQTSGEAIVAIVGNKVVETEDDAEVAFEDVQAMFAIREDWITAEVNCGTGEGLDELFNAIFDKLR